MRLTLLRRSNSRLSGYRCFLVSLVLACFVSTSAFASWLSPKQKPVDVKSHVIKSPFKDLKVLIKERKRNRPHPECPEGTGFCYLNVKRDFGAVGDGVADDTEAIQNALENRSGRRTMVYLPPGVYRVTSELSVGENMEFYGRYDPLGPVPGTVLIYDFDRFEGGWRTQYNQRAYFSMPLPLYGPLTIAGYVRFDRLEQRRQKIIYLGDDAQKQVTYSLGKDEYTDKIEFAFSTDYGLKRWELLSNTILETGRWYHVVVVRDEQTVRLYLDGQLDQERFTLYHGDDSPEEHDRFTGRADLPHDGSCLRIGSVCRQGDYLAGAIDDLRVYERALNPDEISTPGEQGLVAHWRFDGKSLVRFHDSSGNGLNGVFANVPGYVRSVFPSQGWALWLDGTRDYGMVPTALDERVMLRVRDEDVVIRGLELDGRRGRLWGHKSYGLRIEDGARNVFVTRFYAHDFQSSAGSANAGDGILVGRVNVWGGTDNPDTDEDEAAPQTIHLSNIRLDGNGRNGLSVTRVDGLRIEKLRASDNEFVGVDFEPDSHDKGYIRHVRISDIRASDNWLAGIAVNDVRDIEADDLYVEDNGVYGLGVNVFNPEQDAVDPSLVGTCSFSDVVSRRNGGSCPYYYRNCGIEKGGVVLRHRFKIPCNVAIRGFRLEDNQQRGVNILGHPSFTFLDGLIRGSPNFIHLSEDTQFESRIEQVSFQRGGSRPLSILGPPIPMSQPLRVKNITCDGGVGRDCVDISGESRNIMME